MQESQLKKVLMDEALIELSAEAYILKYWNHKFNSFQVFHNTDSIMIFYYYCS